MASSTGLLRLSRTSLWSTQLGSIRAVPVIRCTGCRPPALAALARYYASKSYPSHTVVSMPALSPTMTAGNIGAWQQKVGDTLSPGDVLVEIETDKAQMDFEFQEEGTLAKILKESGEKDVAVGSPIAVMVEEGADVSAFESFTIEDAGGDKAQETPDKKDESAGAPSEKAPEPSKDDSKTTSAPASIESTSTGEKLQTALDREPLVAPAVRKLALEKGVPISQLKGSGPAGRITKEDVEKYAPATSAAPAAAAYEDTPATSMRKVIAARLTESVNKNPHYFVSSTTSVTKLLKLRAALNAASAGAYKLSVNDFLVKAISIAARKVPAANSSWREQSGAVVIRRHHTVDVSVAVATPSGLMTPIVTNVGARGLADISAAVKDLGKRARDGKLAPEEYQGGTITISNMGMNDAVEGFTAVINPPQAAIVAVGTTRKVAVPAPAEEGEEPGVAWDDQIVLTGSFDHKVVDGAVGGEFMRELKKVVENPLEMML
ncbi:dihydrolipoamide acetyltransferase component of pyruvate dehydrogenase [Eremomyces bilateralis CBS 781.70]|uniref:Acetyltransferase component of pyruvate dehydrogenase complex n=1 Tax=Eremomyces bilateralis CBS 781.70 TaxID=1392243 RepID=A0A6G1G0X8_9PEZI|nr:dihydrolipoamide acetyltransferase component of pyruvate dehydrogenase [Eremomyces bilateralis CBS 781.70]KAF1811580.1 dihydrolipoamide acetyltransferase component of pyruvate dehydrogenase [Eremomyces bilateralis CBS 781.70]